MFKVIYWSCGNRVVCGDVYETRQQAERKVANIKKYPSTSGVEIVDACVFCDNQGDTGGCCNCGLNSDE